MSDQEQRSDSQQGTPNHEKSQSPRPSRSRSRSRTPRSRSRSRSRHRRSYTRSRSRSRSRRHRRYRSRSRSRTPRHRRYSRGRRHSRSPMSNRRRHVGNRENPPTSRCLGIFGLSLYTQERDLRDVFSKYGNVEDVQIVYDAQTGRSRGFAFIYFEQSEDAKLAKERCTGMEVDGRRIRVDFSITQRAHTPTPGIYMGKPTYTGGRYSGGSGGNENSGSGGGGGGGGGGSGGEGGRNYRRSPSPYYRRSRYSRSRSRSYSPQFEERNKRKKV